MKGPNINLDLTPAAEWELWYQDTFDADCPRQVELAGCGLGEAILALAATSTSREDFAAHLSRLAVPITIRVATQDDLGALARLNEHFNDVKTTAAQIAARMADPQCAEIPIVAEVEKQIVGFAGLRVVPLLFYAGAHAELTELFVAEAYRRRGVGQALIRFAECLAESKGAEELVLHTGEENQTAQEFYTAMGYEAWEIVMGKDIVAR